MPTLLEAPKQPATLDGTGYAATLESFAPGIVNLINQTQVIGEDWYNTVDRLLPSIQATSEQKAFIKAQADNARSGIDSLANNLGVSHTVLYALIGLLVWKVAL